MKLLKVAARKERHVHDLFIRSNFASIKGL